MKLENWIEKVFNNPVEFISRLQIVDKKGKKIKLNPTEEQIQIIHSLQEGEDTLILKPRQIGASTIVAAYFFWKTLTADQPYSYGILSHKLASSKHLLKIHKNFYYTLPAELKELFPLKVDNATQILFEHNGASLNAVSSGGDGGLRSFTYNGLHISEFAFTPEPAELMATAIAALNGNQLCIESTANFYNDALHQEIMKSERGEATWNFLFFPWYNHKSYNIVFNQASRPEWSEEELRIKEEFDLNEKQLFWRRKQIEKIGFQKFTREYPTSVEEAYKQTGNSYLSQRDLEGIEVVRVDVTDWTHFTDGPDHDDSYAIGVDVAAGVGKDYSVILVLSKKTNGIVSIYRSNLVTPVELAELIVDTATQYNNALVLVESNNYGAVVINELEKQYNYNKLWKDNEGKDFYTSGKSKVAIFERVKEALAKGYIPFLDNITFQELRSLQVNARGTILIPENLSSHGDSAMAFAFALWCLDSVRLSKRTFLPEWITARKADKIRVSGGARPAQHRRY